MVPNGWEHKSFKQILKLDRGSSPRPIVNFITKNDDGVNWIKIGDTKGEAAFINSTKQKITKEGAKKSREVIKGEIILSNSMSYGKPYILNIDGFIHDGWFVIRHYEKNLDRDYLIQLLGGELVQRQYKRLAAGGVVSNINSELVYSVKVDIPPIPEQRKIANILATWDKAISTTKLLIDNSKQQKIALMQQLLKGALTNKRLLDDSGKPFEGELEEVLLEEHIAFLSGHAFKSSEFKKNEKYKLLRGINITKGSLRWGEEQTFSWPEDLQFKKYSLEVNDIVISMDGSLVGRNYALISHAKMEPMLLVQRVARLRCKNTLFYGYLLQHIASEHFKSYVDAVKTVTAIPHISAKDIKHFKIPLPTVKEQEKIAAVLTNADKEIVVLERQLADLKQEKKALMQQLLTGKRRVRIDETEVA
jgi:type I restriction enzyme S subunit